MIKDFKQIDNLSPTDFEYFVKDLFTAAGWSNAIVTKVGDEYAHGDGGVDIFAFKNNQKFAIEVKQRQQGTSVEVSALNQLVTGSRLSNSNQMILVTNSTFTSEVKIRALRLGVELLDRDRLQNMWIEKHSEIGRTIKPLKYQETIINQCLENFNKGKRRVLIEMATGLGKTYTAALLVKKIMKDQPKYRVLFLAHQVEIVLQAVTEFKNIFGIGYYTFSACFDGSDPEETDFVFACFDTLYIKIKELSSSCFDIIIVDEAHHAPAQTYATVISHFQSRFLIGLTATPYREDSKDVLKLFGGSEGHIGKYDLEWALRNKKLAFPKYIVLLDDLDQSRIDMLDQGLNVSDIDNKLFLHKKDEEVIKIIEKTVYEKKIINPKGMVFCRSIEHIKHLMLFFLPGSATFVHSKMAPEQRRKNIQDFREGEYKYILVCNLFNEGIDIPETNILIFMRYTGSRTVWLQQLGRGLRKTKNKDCVYVLDFVGSLERIDEIMALKHSIDKSSIDSTGIECMSGYKDSVVHDESIEVTYNQSAAQVLKLIEEMKYRLKSREQAIEMFRKFYETNNEIPSFDKIEIQLPGISYDQISTHFESFVGYIKSSLPDEPLPEKIYFQCFNYIRDFISKHGIRPSNKAISLASEFENLLLYTDKEVNFLSSHSLTESFLVHDETPKKIDTEEAPNIVDPSKSPLGLELINQYFLSVRTAADVQGLAINIRKKIKACFNSEFYFLKMLRQKRDNGNGHL